MIAWATARPKAVLALSLAVVLTGAVALTRLQLATRPRVELPRLSVQASWPGASAEVVESYVTSRLEAVIQTVRGVDRVSSTSREGEARLDVRLRAGTDVRLARLELIELSETVRPSFPPGAQPPRVSHYVPESLREPVFLQYALVGPYAPEALAAAAREALVPGLSAVPGVASVEVQGGGRRAVIVSYDAARVRALGLRAEDLSAALATSRIVRPVGAEQREDRSLQRPLTVRDEPVAFESLAVLPVGRAGTVTLRLGDLARVGIGSDERGRFYRTNGRPAVTLTMSRLAEANALRTAARARQRLAELVPALPLGVNLMKEQDESEPLAVELKRIAQRSVVALLAVVLVLVIAFHRPRPVLLVLAVVLVTLGATALALFLFGIPVNLLTLAGLGMGVGILVNNGLIVVERLRADSPASAPDRAAAAEAAAPAILGTTLTTIVVLLPFLYLQGDARAAFQPFAAAFALALCLSVFVALTFVPAFTGWIVRDGWPGSGVGGGGARALDFYARALTPLIRRRWVVLAAAGALLAWLGWAFTTKVPRFTFGRWWGEQSYLIARISFPRGSDPAMLDWAARRFERAALAADGVARVTATGGGLGAQVRVDFTLEAGATGLPYLLKDRLTAEAVNVGGADVSVQGFGPGFSSGGYGSPQYSIRVLGYEYAGVERLAEALAARLRRIPRVRDVDPNAGSTFWVRDKAHEVVLVPDRAALARAGLNAAEFAAAVGREIAGPVGAVRLAIAGEELPVVLKAVGAESRTLGQLEQAVVQGTGGGGRAARIGALATVGERQVLADIVRENQQYRRVLTYEFRGPQKLGDRVYKSVLAGTAPPPGYAVAERGYWFEPDESAKGLWLVFGVAVVLVLLVTAAVYDSIWVTAIVFLSLPLAFAGVAGAFLVSSAAFTREAAVGVILVVGLAVNQAILLADRAAVHRRAGVAPTIAAERAARDSFGVVLLTGLTTIASLVPLSVGTAADTLFGAIALATAGGTVASTVATLTILPAVTAVLWRPARTS